MTKISFFLLTINVTMVVVSLSSLKFGFLRSDSISSLTPSGLVGVIVGVAFNEKDNNTMVNPLSRCLKNS